VIHSRGFPDSLKRVTLELTNMNSDNLDDAMKQLIAAVKSAEIIDLPIETLAPAIDDQLRSQLLSAHRLDGAAVSMGNMAVLGFRTTSSSRDFLSLPTSALRAMPYGWALEFGSALSVWLSSPAKASSPRLNPRVILGKDCMALPLMSSGVFEFVLYAGEKPMRYCSVSFGNLLAHEVSTVLNHQAMYHSHKEALFWQIVAALNSSPESMKLLTPDERLSVGWLHDYRFAVKCFLEERDPLVNSFDFSTYQSANLPPIAQEFLGACLPSQFDCGAVVQYTNRLFSSLTTFMSFAQDAAYKDVDEQFRSKFSNLVSWVIQLGLRAPDNTACGRKVMWVKGGDGTGIGHFEPDAGSFPDYFKPEDYWERLPYSVPYWALGALVSPGDVPAHLPPSSEVWGRFPQTDASARADTLAVADCLIEEALANRKWIIPNRALVQVPIGPFTHFEVTEIGAEVFFVGRTERGEFSIAIVEPEKGELVFPLLSALYWSNPDLYASVHASLKMLFAAVIRDFWVVEERDAVFSPKNVKRLGGVRIRKAEDGSPRIVYLPRINYREKPSPTKCRDSLDHTTRSAHFVQQHLRKVGQPSDLQILLAKQYGVSVPEGYTFVRPHERGANSARLIIYRSRSALQSLYSADGTTSSGVAEWFKFEKDVAKVFSSLGFDVQHKSASRSGDQGVDLVATKGKDFEAVNWVIQCKCYRIDFSIGPDKVRELHGVVATYPSGTRGMLVATCSFSSGAKKLADELNIRLIDGGQFARLANVQA
jgi:HJR/Mrr/RecB family endonuclease